MCYSKLGHFRDSLSFAFSLFTTLFTFVACPIAAIVIATIIVPVVTVITASLLYHCRFLVSLIFIIYVFNYKMNMFKRLFCCGCFCMFIHFLIPLHVLLLYLLGR